MQRALTLHQTTVGKKAIAAITGAILFLFLIGHLVGNLQLFLGPVDGAQAMHDYAVMLRKTGPALWVARIVLLLSVGLHIWATISLAMRNGEARKTPYKRGRENVLSTYASRTMHWSGPIVALYIAYHIMHLTLGFAPDHNVQNVYDNVVFGFQDWKISTVYIVANLLLGGHLLHGAWSWLQTLGASHPRYNKWRPIFAIAIAGFLTLGNVGIPVAVMTGVIQPSQNFTACSELLGECPAGERP